MTWDDVQAEITANNAADYRQTYGDTAADAASAGGLIRRANARLEDICEAYEDNHTDPENLNPDPVIQATIEDLTAAIGVLKRILDK